MESTTIAFFITATPRRCLGVAEGTSLEASWEEGGASEVKLPPLIFVSLPQQLTVSGSRNLEWGSAFFCSSLSIATHLLLLRAAFCQFVKSVSRNRGRSIASEIVRVDFNGARGEIGMDTLDPLVLAFGEHSWKGFP